MSLKELKLRQISVDRELQARVELDEQAVVEYSREMRNEAQFPAVVVFTDGEAYWLSDGFHRHAAAKKAGRKTIEADVREGTRRDALLFAAGANARHGLRRTKADKRRAVQLLLEDEEWAARSDRWIAEHAAVSHTFVGNVRRQLATFPVGPSVSPQNQLATLPVEDSQDSPRKPPGAPSSNGEDRPTPVESPQKPPEATVGRDGKVRRRPRESPSAVPSSGEVSPTEPTSPSVPAESNSSVAREIAELTAGFRHKISRIARNLESGDDLQRLIEEMDRLLAWLRNRQDSEAAA